MDKMTRDLIYSLKASAIGSDSYIDALKDFMSDYTCTPKEHYSPGNLRSVAKNAFLDFIRTSDNPVVAVREYFDALDKPWVHSDIEAILIALMMTRVRDSSGQYINGFWGDEEQKNAVVKNGGE